MERTFMLATVVLLSGYAVARADDTPPIAVPRPPYAIPFTLRPAIAPNAVRFDNTFDASSDGLAYVPILTAAVRVHPDISPFVRVGAAAWNHPAFVNPFVGALYTPDVGFGLRPAFSLGLTLPLGSGEGSPPSAADTEALAYGRRARMGVDNALFATNYASLVAGVGLAWLHAGLTIQLDLTLIHAIGSRAPVNDAYDDSTNFVGALWIGCVVLPWLQIGGELRHQQFIDAPIAIRNADAMGGPSQSYQTSLGIGLRFRIPIHGSAALMLGLAYSRGLDGWMSAHDDNVFQLDLPFVF